MKKAFLKKIVIAVIVATSMTTLSTLGVSAATNNSTANNFYNSILNRTLKTGWVNDNGKWYYCNSSAAAPDSQRPDPDRLGRDRRLPGVDEVDPLPVPLHPPRRLQERGEHPQGLAGPDRRRQRGQGREHQERLRQRSHRELREQLLGCDLHRRHRRSADPQRRPGCDPAADLPGGQLLPRREPGQPERPQSLAAAARSRSPRPPPRSSSTKSSPRSSVRTAPTCRSCSRATAPR